MDIYNTFRELCLFSQCVADASVTSGYYPARIGRMFFFSSFNLTWVVISSHTPVSLRERRQERNSSYTARGRTVARPFPRRPLPPKHGRQIDRTPVRIDRTTGQPRRNFPPDFCCSQGERRFWLGAQVDDHFLDTNVFEWDGDTNAGATTVWTRDRVV